MSLGTPADPYISFTVNQTSWPRCSRVTRRAARVSTTPAPRPTASTRISTLGALSFARSSSARDNTRLAEETVSVFPQTSSTLATLPTYEHTTLLSCPKRATSTPNWMGLCVGWLCLVPPSSSPTKTFARRSGLNKLDVDTSGKSARTLAMYRGSSSPQRWRASSAHCWEISTLLSRGGTSSPVKFGVADAGILMRFHNEAYLSFKKTLPNSVLRSSGLPIAMIRQSAVVVTASAPVQISSGTPQLSSMTTKTPSDRWIP